jgi:hypothetical protein
MILALCCLLRLCCSALSKCCSDLCLLLARGLEDAFPDAKKAAAAGLAALAHKLPQGALEDSAERLVQVCGMVLSCCGVLCGACSFVQLIALLCAVQYMYISIYAS